MAVEQAKTLIECRERLKEKLDGSFVRKDDPDPRKRFAPRGATREIFELDRLEHFLRLLYTDTAGLSHFVTPTDLKSIAEKIRGSEGSSSCYNNVLAILVYSQCKDQTLIEFVECLRHEEASKPTPDCDLPLTQHMACEAFGTDDGLKFWQDQFLFCPVVLKESDEVTYVDHKQACPRPFPEEPKKIGQGAYAIVYMVKIEKGHLVNDQGFNDRNAYAMKEFTGYDAEAKKSFSAEAATIKEFIQCAKSHNNIAITRASLEWGKTYSLFFDLAKCNLYQYFTNGADTISNLEDKQRVFSQTIGLTGALACLHDELYLDSTNERLQCYHLDLKPQNILVFETSGKQIWKISDFGISKIKRIPSGQPESEHHLSVLDKIFQSKPDGDPSSGVNNSRYGGTYAAPEAKEKSDTVTRKSDVWSLGCVIALTLTFLQHPSHGIDLFEKARAKDRSHDWFFDSKALKAGSESKEILHVSVSNWLDKLNEDASRRDSSEAKATKMATELLRTKMFLRDQEKRLSAKKVERELQRIQSAFTKPIESPTIQIESSKRMWPLKLPHWPRHSKASHKATSLQQPWSFKIPHTPKKCKFGADGRYLCVTSDDGIAIMPVSGIQQGQSSQTATPFTSPKDKQWADFSVGSNYLCIALDSEYLEFSYLPLSAQDGKERLDLHTNVKCRIRKVVISPNDQITAFVLEDSQQESKVWKLALYHTDDLFGLPKSSNASVNTYADPSISRVSTKASSLEHLPWKDILTRSQDSELPVDAQIVDLKFSRNSNILMGITQPFNQRDGPGMQYEVITWNVVNGQRFSGLGNHTTGYDGMGESWAVEAFAVLATQRSFATISKKRIRLGEYDPPGYKTQSKLLSDELIDALVTDEEDDLIIVGHSNEKKDINAFRISTGKIRKLESLGTGIPTDSRRYNRVTDCCCLSEREDRLTIMLATIDAKHRHCVLYETFLE